MRLTVNEITLLKEKLALLSREAKLYLFGSRVDDSKRGGDIDLLVVSFTNPFHKMISDKAVLL